ncbi:MAG: acyl carrier protein [Vicinamibacterales bacterium]
MDADFERRVQDAIASVCNLDRAKVALDAKLTDLGVDSLAAAEVLVELEIAFGRDLPVDALRKLDGAETVRDIARQLEAAFGPGAAQA